MPNYQLVIASVGDIAMLRKPSAALYSEPWHNSDLRIANLEAPLTDGGVPAAKLIRLKTPPQGATWLKELRCDAVSLANNHILDWGAQGLESTLAALDGAGVKHAGAGANAEQAGKHIILNANGSRIAFLSWSCTNPPGFIARTDRPGLAGVRVRTAFASDPALEEQPGTPPWVHTEAVENDVEKLLGAIKAARADSDFVILALHWGVPPQWQARFQGPLAEYQIPLGKQIIGAGADLVLGCHAHTVYGIESVVRSAGGSGLICYSLGNYVFHPLANNIERDLDSPMAPYRAPSLLENSQTFIARFTLEKNAGKLAFKQVELVPAFLDQNWETVPPTQEQARAINQRVAEFSKERGTVVEIKKNIVTWKT